MLKKLGRLKGRGARELRVRGAQALAAAAERAGVSRLSRVPSDEAFLRALGAQQTEKGFKSAEAWLEHFRARTRPRFFAGFDDEDATRAALRSRFDDESEAVVNRAERILNGRFDLLGLKDLDFGSPVDWHLEPLSRVRAPLVHWSRIDFLDPKVSGDKKFVWELNRHQFFQTLGRAYWRTGDERYAEGFARYAAEWMDANPPKLGVNWASSLEVSFRTISWLWALHFFKRSPRLTPALFLRLTKFLYLNARHLETYLSTYFSPNTHLTGEALGLFYVGTLLPELQGAGRWRETGRRVLLEELDRHVRGDGVYFEQATYYHRYTADFYTHFALLSRAGEGGQNAGSREARLSSKLSALLDHLMFITRPDGTTPFLGDDDGGRLCMLDERSAGDFRAALSNGAVLFKRADYKFVAGRAAEETLWLAGAEGLKAFDALDAREPAEESRAFREGGYYVMRDGWSRTADYMLLDCGPHGAEGIGCGHAHADALSFELAARGRTLLVDPGTYTYTGSREERERFRSTRAHNALDVDGASSSEPGEGPFRWSRVARATARRWVAAKTFDLFEGGHDGFLRLDPPVEYSRSVLFLKGDYWVLRDAARPRLADTEGGGGAHSYETHFHFAPGAEASPGERGGAFVLTTRDRGAAGLEILATRSDGPWSRGDGWVSPCYGARVRATVCTRSLKTDTPFDSFVFIRPRAAGADETARLEELKAEGGRAFGLRCGPWRDILIVRTNDAGGRVTASGFDSDFDWAWLRFFAETGALAELVVVGGTGLASGGRRLVESVGGRIGYFAARGGDGPGRVVESDGLSRCSAPVLSEPFEVLLDGGGENDGDGEELEDSLTYVRD